MVRYNHRVLRAFWIAGYAAWEGYTAAHRTLTQNTPLDLKRFVSLLSSFDAVIFSDRPELEPLPKGVAEPGHYADRNVDAESRAEAELQHSPRGGRSCMKSIISSGSKKAQAQTRMKPIRPEDARRSYPAIFTQLNFFSRMRTSMPPVKPWQRIWSCLSVSSAFTSRCSASRCSPKTIGATRPPTPLFRSGSTQCIRR